MATTLTTPRPIPFTDEYSRGENITPYKVKRATVAWDQIYGDPVDVPIPMPQKAIVIEVGLIISEVFDAGGTAQLVFGDAQISVGATLPLGALATETWKQAVPETAGLLPHLVITGAVGAAKGRVTAILLFIDEE